MVISSPQQYGQLKLQYPSKVAKNLFGKCLVAEVDLEQGEVVERYEGPILNCWADMPLEEICYGLVIDTNQYMMVQSNARYINHACNPNCDIDEDYDVVTLKSVKKGEELTICYNEIFPEHEGLNYFWDPRWTFTCRCGAANCVGKIDRYMVYKRPADFR